MKLPVLLLIVLCLKGTLAGANTKILWFGAHPDDEIPASALLHNLCHRTDVDCKIVSLTDGGNGSCLKTKGCYPNLVDVRRMEFQNSAEILSATSEILNLNDGFAGYQGHPSDSDLVLSNWVNQTGGTASLKSLIGNQIQTYQPDIVFTFDPRHGTTCHPDHMATARLTAIVAMESGVSPDQIFLLQSVLAADSHGVGYRPFDSNDPLTSVFPIVEYWPLVTYLMGQIYTSQYTSENVELVSRTPDSYKTLSIKKLSDFNTDDWNKTPCRD